MRLFIFTLLAIFSLNSYSKTISVNCESNSSTPYNRFMLATGKLELNESDSTLIGSLDVSLPQSNKNFNSINVTGKYSDFSSDFSQDYSITMYHNYEDIGLYSIISLYTYAGAHMTLIYNFATYECRAKITEL